MKIKRFGIAVLGIIGMLLCGGGGIYVYAEEEGNVFSYEEDGLVEGSREFTIPAAKGENFDIEITFTASGSEGGVLSFAYDKVTDDQMVQNVYADADDRSGLLNEPVRQGVEETRRFTVAALDGDIVIKATGNGRVISIKAVQCAAKEPGEKVTVYTIGDSLVQTYSEKYAPQTGWGQMLPLYFDDGVTFVNYALGGRSTGNYLRQGRLNQVLCELAPGDYVLIEFGHNDSTSGNQDRYVSVPNFKKNLADIYIKAIRDRGAIPVLVTLCNRNQYRREGDFTVSFPEYVEAMRETAQETDTPLIDLNALTVTYFTKLNQELGIGITDSIIYNHAIAGAYEGEYEKGVKDNTHLQGYGAKVVAGLVAEELQRLGLEGVSEHYMPVVVNELPETPTEIAEKQYEGFVSRITWKASDRADYYKILVAPVTEKQSGEGGVSGVTAPENGTGQLPGYMLAGDFELAGYTTVCDFAYTQAEEGLHYAYKIIAVNAVGESPESEVFSFGLLTEEAISEEGIEDSVGNGMGDEVQDTVGEPMAKGSFTRLLLISAVGGMGLAAVCVYLYYCFRRKR